MPRIIITVVAIIIGILVAVFTVDSGDVVRFNDRSVEILTQMDSTFEQPIDLLSQYAETGQCSPDALDQAVNSSRSLLETHEKALRDLGVPDDDLCRDFHSAAIAYVESSEKFLTGIGELSGYIRDHQPGTDADREHVSSTLDQMFASDMVVLMDLQSKQAAMAKEYKITLE